MTVLSNLIGKLLFRSRDAARGETIRQIVARYSRGNTSVQFGRYLNEADLQRLHAKGDKAFKRLSKRVLAKTP